MSLVIPWDLLGVWGLASGISYQCRPGVFCRYIAYGWLELVSFICLLNTIFFYWQSPTGLITGMAQGSTSLLSNTVYAITDAATQFSKAAQKVSPMINISMLPKISFYIICIVIVFSAACRVLLHLHLMTRLFRGWKSNR